MAEAYHALGLHMHQPPDNLKVLVEQEMWEARQILLCYERPLKYLRRYEDCARLHIGFSGVLLEQFLDQDIVDRYRSIVDIPQMLKDYAGVENLELIGMGYYHPIFPLIPQDDWAEQLARNKEMVLKVFGKEPKGFWPPEMAFTMEMVPYLKQAGYEYVLIDSVHVKPVTGEPIKCTPFKPYKAEHRGHEITVIPRDRDLSNAQQSGFDPHWFEAQVSSKTSGCSPPSLITTWSDGENGGWFRQIYEPSGFWGHYFAPYMEAIRAGTITIKPVLISEYIKQNPPTEYVTVRTGAWNVGSTSGYDFSQWAGTANQRRAVDEIFLVSREYHQLKLAIETRSNDYRSTAAKRFLDDAYRYVLQAETSCYLFWGDAWVDKVYDVTRRARGLLGKAKRFV